MPIPDRAETVARHRHLQGPNRRDRVGLHEATDPNEDADTIIGGADALLYRAKRAGRDRIVAGDSTARALAAA